MRRRKIHPINLLWLAAATVVVGLTTIAPVRGQGAYPAARTGANYMHNYYFPPAPSSTPWAPSWSPDGKSLAVAMSGSIWSVDPLSGVARELTYGPTYHSSPDWSPDGRWIIYTADSSSKTIQLEILNVATGEARPLTSDAFIYTDPVFSPDGGRVAYVSTKPSGYFNVFVRPIKDGQWAGDEVAVTKDNKFPNDRLYFGAADLHITPAWLPDGKELLIVSNRDVALGSGNVLRVPASDGGGMAQARPVLVEQTLYRTRPDVSGDGKRFVYSSTRGTADQFSNLYVQPTLGGEPYKLTFFEHDAFHPRWSPDGEWIAYIDNREGLPELALLETHGGSNRIVRIADRRWKRPMGVLSVRTLDDRGQTTGARIHLTASDGKAYPPLDAYGRISAAGDRIFHIPGAFRVEVPVGKVALTAVKGFEFVPASVTAEIRAGEVTSLAIPLARMTDMNARGWYSGSTHVHMNYAGNLHNTLENLMMMSAAEDQDIVLEQIANKDNRILDYQFFIKGGGPHPLSRPDMLLVVGQEYRPPFWGHVFMFGMRDHLMSPFTVGYEGTAIESLYPTNTDMFRKAKAQGAYVGYVHAFGGEADPLAGNLGAGKGFMVDAALGTTDAVEWSAASRSGFFPLYAVWNNGLKVAAVGGEDSISNLHMSKLVGSHRTYVHTGGKGLDMHAWLDGMRQGRAFVTNGPLVELTVNGMRPGETVSVPASGGRVRVEGRVRSIVPLQKVTLVFNGQAVDELPLGTDRKTADLDKLLPVSASGWYHLRAEGAPADRAPLDTGYPQAFTNPIWVNVGDRPVRSRASAEYSLNWIDKLQQLADAWPGWRSQKEKDHVHAQLNEARAVYRQLMSEAR